MTLSNLREHAEAAGRRATKTPPPKSRQKKASRFDYRAMFYVVLAALVGGGLISNASNIMDIIWLLKTDNSETITLPRLPATLHNSSDDAIAIPVKGNCLLWPPEPHRWDYEGAYQFKSKDLRPIDSDKIAIPARSERAFFIELVKAAPIHQTETSLKRFLVTGEWQVQFILETDQYGRSFINSDRLPFTAEAFSAGHIFEVSRKPSPGVPIN